MSENINPIANAVPNDAEQKGKTRQEKIIDFKEKIKEIEEELEDELTKIVLKNTAFIK